MGKVKKISVSTTPNFTSIQRLVFNEFSKNKILRERFYFTGGTALSAFYLTHRESEDLDFFSESNFENKLTDKFIEHIAETLKLESRLTQINDTRIYELSKGKRLIIKIDFNTYPYRRLKKGLKFQEVTVDNLFDIATNKLQTIISRTQVKDFVDLYFLLQKFSFWDLLYGVKEKFRMDDDLVLLSSNFLQVKQFDTLPKMLVPLTLKELKDFYMELAKKIGKRITEK